jgi:hypothetical protein
MNTNYILPLCPLNDRELEIAYNNPHCLEYFCTFNKLIDCTKCYNYLLNKKLLSRKEFLLKQDKNIKTVFEKNKRYILSEQLDDKSCSEKCYKKGYLYESAISKEKTEYKLDDYKKIDNFYKTKLLTKLNDIPYVLKYEGTTPKPKTVVHFGQLKMFLITLIFLLETVKEDDSIVNIVYAGSAPGDNISTLCSMFPNTRWYLIDPRNFNKELYNHKQVLEARNEFFTDELAEYYKKKLNNKKDKLLFISDIRLDTGTDDDSVMKDQESQINWHKIISPDYSYFKFRCPYDKPYKYNYYDGSIFIQPFAPISSTESRILLENKLKEKVYDKFEYEGKFIYFNRVLRPIKIYFINKFLYISITNLAKLN